MGKDSKSTATLESISNRLESVTIFLKADMPVRSPVLPEVGIEIYMDKNRFSGVTVRQFQMRRVGNNSFEVLAKCMQWNNADNREHNTMADALAAIKERWGKGALRIDQIQVRSRKCPISPKALKDLVTNTFTGIFEHSTIETQPENPMRRARKKK